MAEGELNVENEGNCNSLDMTNKSYQLTQIDIDGLRILQIERMLVFVSINCFHGDTWDKYIGIHSLAEPFVSTCKLHKQFNIESAIKLAT